MMEISVIVVCFNEEKSIGTCLDSLLAQKDCIYEVIVVDGDSQDSTRQIVQEYQKRSGLIRLEVNPKRSIASNRNVGIKAAKYPYAAFTDADCRVPVDWLLELSKAFESHFKRDARIVGVGGGNFAVPADTGNKFSLAVGIALNTFLGSLGSIQGKRYPQYRYVPSLAGLNVLYEKEKLVDIGGFDEEFGNMCEDADINFRLLRKGGRLVYVPGCVVEHRLDFNPKSWLKSMYAYGRGRAFLIRKHRCINPVYLLPLVFLFVMFSLLFAGFEKKFLLPLLYFPVIFLCGMAAAISANRPALSGRVFIVYTYQHFAYAWGLTRGLIGEKK